MEELLLIYMNIFPECEIHSKFSDSTKYVQYLPLYAIKNVEILLSSVFQLLNSVFILHCNIMDFISLIEITY